MEDSGVLNAGCGSYLTEEGTVELDAMIMDGQTLNTGKLIYFIFKCSMHLKKITRIIIQQIVTLSKYGHDALNICRPYSTDIL